MRAENFKDMLELDMLNVQKIYKNILIFLSMCKVKILYFNPKYKLNEEEYRCFKLFPSTRAFRNLNYSYDLVQIAQENKISKFIARNTIRKIYLKPDIYFYQFKDKKFRFKEFKKRAE